MYFFYFNTFLNCIKFKLKSPANSYRVRDLKNEAYIPAEKLKNRKSFTHKYIKNESIWSFVAYICITFITLGEKKTR